MADPHVGHHHCKGCSICVDPTMLSHGYCPKCVRVITKRMRKKANVVAKRKGKKPGKPKHLRDKAGDSGDA